MIRVGDKVVCVDDTPLCARQRVLVKKGEVYTVAEMRRGPLGEWGINLAEVAFPANRRSGAYYLRRFRKVREEFSGMGVLRSLLVPKKVEA